MTREEILNLAMTSPDELELFAGASIRKHDLQAEVMCARCGIALPSAEIFVEAAKNPIELLKVFPQLSEYVFIHAEDRGVIEKLVYESPSKIPLEADRFFGKIPPERLEAMLMFIYFDTAALAAAKAKIIDEGSGVVSKNAPSPAA